MVDYKIDTKDFLSFHKSSSDPDQVTNAKTWYYNFTGKQYDNEDIKELMEIYKILKNSS